MPKNQKYSAEEKQRPFRPQFRKLRKEGRGSGSFLGRVLGARGGGERSAGSKGGAKFSRGAGRVYKTRTEFKQRVVVKARIVKHRSRGRGRGTLAAHLSYVEREGVGLSGEKGRAFGEKGFLSEPEKSQWIEGAKKDRHHFRFIVSPENAAELDLERFARRFMSQAARDLKTQLEWISVVHQNTDNPHIHFIVRGIREDGRDLVMSRDYIASGLRSMGSELATKELGPRLSEEIKQEIERSVHAGRFTALDREIMEWSAGEMLERNNVSRSKRSELLVKRLGQLERWNLAGETETGWRLEPGMESKLRERGTERDIIKRLNEGLKRDVGKVERLNAAEIKSQAVSGEVVSVRLVDELSERCSVTIKGDDGKLFSVFSRLEKVRGLGAGTRVSVARELRRGSIRALAFADQELWVSVQVEQGRKRQAAVRQFGDEAEENHSRSRRRGTFLQELRRHGREI